MSEHLTPGEVREFLRHRLPPARIGSAARHLAHCPACATAVREGYDVPAAGRAVGRSILTRERTSTRWLAIAAAAAICVAGLGAFIAWIPARTPIPSARTRIVAPSDRWAGIAAAAHTNGTVIMPEVLHALRPSVGPLRGAEAAGPQRRLRPAGIVVEEDRPELRWEAVPQATSYRVLLFRGPTPIAESSPLAACAWRPEQPLDRDATYEWQVIATTPHGEVALPAPPSAPVLFRVLSRREHDDLEAARRAHPHDRLVLGVLYARAGLVGHAVEELGAYAATHPGDLKAQALWRSVESWERRE
jgi:hypothetical protein